MKKSHEQSIRIFKNPILESFTHVHPMTPLILWAPIISYLFFYGATKNGVNIFQFIILFFVGLISWTLSEYILHRFVFHWEAQSRAGKYFVFLFHGLHHDDPQDPTRLVMPPVPAILLSGILYCLFSLVIPGKFLQVFMGYFMIGYLCYDYIHYATHHFSMGSKIGKFLRKYHLQHHYSGEKSKYGVSSPLWDYVFKTISGPSENH